MSAPSITARGEIRLLLDTGFDNATQLHHYLAGALHHPLSLMSGAAFGSVEIPTWLWTSPACTVTLFGDDHFGLWL